MNEVLYIDSECRRKALKKRARAEVNLVALASLISTTLTYVFYIVIAFFNPVITQLITNTVENLGHSKIYAAAFAESFMQSHELSWFMSLMVTILCSFVPFAILSRTMLGMKAEEIAPVKGKILGTFPFVYGASLIMASVVSSIAGGLFAFLFPDAYNASATSITEIYGESSGAASLILAFLSLCVVAPFAEEFIYRGIMFGHLKKFGVSFAAISSSLIFGMGHATVDQIAYAFIFGLVLCAVTEKTGNLKTAVIMHFVNNFIGYFRTYLFPVIASEEAGYIFETVYSIVLGVFAIIGMILFFVNRSAKKSDKEEIADNTAEKTVENAPMSSFFCVGSAFVIVFAIINVILGLL